MSRMKVAVLGCGPAGLLAAHAATLAGADVEIFSKIQKSRIGGAQYLYVPIPKVTGSDPDGQCTVYKHGVRSGYAKKVYGDFDAPTSWNEFEEGQVVDVWSMQQAYDNLWEMYGQGIVDLDITPNALLTIDGVYDTHDFTVSCIPRTALCITKQCAFTSQPVWIEQYDRSEKPTDDNWIEYDGTGQKPWYRASRLFNMEGYEYASKPDLDGKVALQINKPLSNECTCWDKALRMQFMGRYGKWQKGVLVHHAYYEMEALTRG